MDKQEIRTAIRRHWIIALVAFVASLLLGAAIALVPKTTYLASATVSVQPSAASGVSGVNNAVFLIPSYVQMVSTNEMHAMVQRAVPALDRNGPVTLSAKSQTGTGLILVSASGSNRNAVATWATAAASRLVNDGNSGQGLLSFSLLQSASIPSSPSFPKPIPIALGAIVLGLIMAPTSAVIAMRMRAAPTQDETRRRFGVPLLASLPQSSSIPEEEPVLRWLQRSADRTYAEALRQLRTSMDLAVGLGARSIGVGSATSGEGKSTTAASLAWSLAAVGVKTCLLDANLRQPELHALVGLPERPGLADSLDHSQLPIRSAGVPNLSLLPPGSSAGHPADVLATSFRSALASLQEQGYLVVVDTPAAKDNPESEWILSQLDAVILVVDRRLMRRTLPDKSLRRLREAGVNVVGIVLNRASRRNLPSRRAERSAKPQGSDPEFHLSGNSRVAGVR